jgi:hypothetical protein
LAAPPVLVRKKEKTRNEKIPKKAITQGIGVYHHCIELNCAKRK